MLESWTEINLWAEPLDETLLTELVDGLVHDLLRDQIATWFFFWEPGLRLRIRWLDPGRADECRRALVARLEEAARAGLISEWFEGAHGRRGETYTGEAEMYGDEVWPVIQKDWMNGSELALFLIRLDRTGALTRSREFHWSRHVHLFTNQLARTWSAEVELCLRQARGYLCHMRAGGTPASAEVRALIAELDGLASNHV